MATNCSVVPLGIDGLAGVTAIDTSVAAVMVRVVEAAMEPEVAVIVPIPNALLAASPWLPAVLLTVARVGTTEKLQVTRLVTSCVLPSVKIPVAVSCCVVPAAIDGLGGLRATDFESGRADRQGSRSADRAWRVCGGDGRSACSGPCC